MIEIIDQFGREQKLEHLSALAHLEDLKRKSGSNPWPVIEACLKLWKEKHPTQWESYLVYLDEIKHSRKVTKGFRGVSRDRAHDAYTSYLLDIPQKVMLLIRAMYNTDELPMNKAFFYEFGKRFPTFLVREKV